MKDTLYEVILTPQQIDTIHGSLVAQEKLYSGLLVGIENQVPDILKWMKENEVTVSTIQNIYYGAYQMLIQFDNFVLGKELPQDFNKTRTILFKEAFEPFSEY